MDPLSLTASVIAIIQLSGSVISAVYNYREGVKNAPKDAATIVRELTGLSQVLDGMLQLIEKDGASTKQQASSLAAFQHLTGKGGLLESCHKSLDDLKAKLQPENGWRAVRQSLVWPLKQEYVKKILEEIAAAKQTLNLALAVDQTSMTLEVKENIDTLKSSFEAFKFDESRKAALARLSPTDPTTNHVRYRERHQSGTGDWFIQSTQYQEWIGQSKSVLWINGIPGCGKSILCSIAIEDLRQNRQPKKPRVGIAYYYFNFQCPEIPKRIFGLEDDSHSPSRLVEFLLGMTTGFEEIYVVIDAIDECEQHYEVMHWIEDIVNRSESSHILASSRQDYHLRVVLSAMATSVIALDEHIFADDIRLYIQKRLENDPRMKKWQKDTQDEVGKSLLTNSGGLFRWVDCQFEVLKKCLRAIDIKKVLDTPPKSLDETYDRIIENIDELHMRDACTILQWLSFSARPLHTDELNEALAFDRSDAQCPRFDPDLRLSILDDVLALCSSLVVVEQTKPIRGEANIGSLEVRLAHNSVRDYLLSRASRHYRLEHFEFEIKLAHAAIAKCCVAYLLQFNYPLDESKLQMFPLSFYAARSWAHHFNQANPSEQDALVSSSLKLLSAQMPFENLHRLLAPGELPPAASAEGKMPMSALYYAVINGLYVVTDLLLKAGADPNKGVRFGGRLGDVFNHGTPLGAAASLGSEELARLLLSSGADPNGRGFAGFRGTPAGEAAARGHTMVLRILKEAGADMNMSGQDGIGPPLYQAVRHEQRDATDFLLSIGVDVDVGDGMSGIKYVVDLAAWANDIELLARLFPLLREWSADFALSEIVRCGRTDVFESLLHTEKGKRLGMAYAGVAGFEDLVQKMLAERVRATGCPVMTELSTLVSSGSVEAVQTLLESIPEKAASDERKTDMLALAVESGQSLIVKYLIDQGADVRNKSCEASLCDASGRGYMAIVSFMLMAGANANSSVEDGKDLADRRTCLYTAVQHNRLEIARLLLSHGADINITYRGRSAFHCSMTNGNEAIFDLLMSNNARIAKIQEEPVHYDSRRLPLQLAAWKGNTHIIRGLLSRGVDIDEVAIDDGWTALFHAAQHGKEGALLVLLEHGANPLQRANGGTVAMQTAAFHGHVACVQLFLNAGVDIDIRGRYGRTALHWSVWECQTDTVQFLIRNGADLTLRDEDENGPRNAVDIANAKLQEIREMPEKDRWRYRQKESRFEVLLEILEGKQIVE